LGQISIVSALSASSQEALVTGSHFARYAKHEPVVRQGEPGDELFLVTHGLVRVQLDTGERTTQIATLGPGEFFGEMSLLTGDVRAASVYAETETELLVVGHDALVAVFERDASALETLAPAVAERQKELSAHLMSGVSIYPPEEPQQLIDRIRSFFRLGRG
jgi:CRP-like cAMP-binding protein